MVWLLYRTARFLRGSAGSTCDAAAISISADRLICCSRPEGVIVIDLRRPRYAPATPWLIPDLGWAHLPHPAGEWRCRLVCAIRGLQRPDAEQRRFARGARRDAVGGLEQAREMRVRAELPAPRHLADAGVARRRRSQIEEGAMQAAAADVIGDAADRHEQPVERGTRQAEMRGHRMGRKLGVGKVRFDILPDAEQRRVGGGAVIGITALQLAFEAGDDEGHRAFHDRLALVER